MKGKPDAFTEGNHDLGRRRNVLHADSEAENREGLENQEQPDRHYQPAERVALHAAEQTALAKDSDKSSEYEARGHGEEVREAGIRIEGDNAVCAEHVELAMGEVDDAHDAEDQHEADRDEREVTCRIGRVQQCLEDQVRHVALRIAAAGPSGLPGAGAPESWRATGMARAEDGQRW